MIGMTNGQEGRGLIYCAITLLLIAAPTAVMAGVVAGTGHEEDTVIGRNAAGQLETIIGSPGLNELPPVNSFLHGWANDEPGNKTPDADDPANDFFMLQDGATINLQLVSIDPGLKVWSPGFNHVLTQPGDFFILGGSSFDTHGTFHIDSLDPSFDPNQADFAVTFKVMDKGTTGYAESAPFTLHFTPVPEPMTLAMLALGGIATIGRGLRNNRKELSI